MNLQNTRRRLAALLILVLAGCASPSRAPIQATPSQPITHVEREAEARSRGDLSSTESRVFSLAPKQLVKPDWAPVLDLEFEGKYRRDAKTSYAIKGSKLMPFEPFDSVGELIADLSSKSPEEQVKAQYREQTGRSLAARDNNEGRLPVEMRNVRLLAYIRAVKWVADEDQDFHVMVCERPTGNGQPCFTTEVSGLPKSQVRTKDFRRARTDLVATLQEHVDANEGKPIAPSDMRNKWAFFEPGVYVEVSGSLYLDAIHGPGTVGPRPSARQSRDHTTPTSWEIHPVRSVRRVEE